MRRNNVGVDMIEMMGVEKGMDGVGHEVAVMPFHLNFVSLRRDDEQRKNTHLVEENSINDPT
jgi:hypothetical protein